MLLVMLPTCCISIVLCLWMLPFASLNVRQPWQGYAVLCAEKQEPKLTS